MKYPLISIIIPVYNVEKYLVQCLESVINQTYKNLEILLIDDGSTDSCVEICDAFANKDSRIKVIHKVNGGLSDARNYGLDISNGEYVAFVDSDDWLEPNMYELMLYELKRSNSDIVVCGLFREYADKTLIEKDIERKKCYESKDALMNLLDGSTIHDHSWSKLYKKDLFDNIRFPVGKTYEDIRTTYRLFMQASLITQIPTALYHYRQRKNSIIRSGITEGKLEWVESIENLMFDKELSDEKYQQIIKYRLVKTKCSLIREMLLYGSVNCSEEAVELFNNLILDVKNNWKKIIKDRELSKSYKTIALLSNLPLSLCDYLFLNCNFNKIISRYAFYE